MEFFPEAHAQTAEATKAAADAAGVFLNQGVLGAVCVFLILALGLAGWVIKGLYNNERTLHEARASETREIVKAIEGFADALEGVEAALLSNKQVLEARAQGLVELSHQLQQSAQETRHSFANLNQMMTGIVTWFRPARGGDAP